MKRLIGNISMAVLILLLFHSATYAYNLPDSEQMLCYDYGGSVIACDTTGLTGQDGAYDINPMSYTDNSNGTVTDNNTGLMWQKCTVGQNATTCIPYDTANHYNWYQATGTADPTYNPSGIQNACGTLNTSKLGDHTDWRLPTAQELQTIVDYAIPAGVVVFYYTGPTIRTAYFPYTIAGYYWTSTTYASYPSYAWVVDFYYGWDRSPDKSADNFVRCVRGGQPAQSFTDNADGTVTDNKTGLVWQQDEPGLMMWGDALSHCEDLNLGGHDDWRLPNTKELKSLVDSSRYYPAINTAYFPNAAASAASSSYWSSTTDASYPDYAWCLWFYDGGIISPYWAKSSAYYVRCVRGGPNGSLGNFIRLMRGGNIINTFNNIQAAYNNAQADDVIQAKNVVSTENQTFVATKAVSLKGGYDSGFTTNTGFTTINGNMTIIGGTVTVENIIIK